MVENLHLDVNTRLVVEDAEDVETAKLVILLVGHELRILEVEIDESIFPLASRHSVNEAQRNVFPFFTPEDELKYEVVRRIVMRNFLHAHIPPCDCHPCSRLSTPLAFWLAWASMDWADWARTFDFVYSVISFAMSASRMVDSDA